LVSAPANAQSLFQAVGVAGLAAAADRPERIAAIVAVNAFGWRPAGKVFRGMLALMGSAAMRETDAHSGWLPTAASGRFGAGRHWDKADRAAYRAGMDRDARRALHRYLDDARTTPLYPAIEAALTGPLRDRPLLTVFGQRNDPLRFQPRWKALFPHARQQVVPHGYHFPMCDAPTDVARWVADWHTAHVPHAA
jgi:haloalkane dehalogenase